VSSLEHGAAWRPVDPSQTWFDYARVVHMSFPDEEFEGSDDESLYKGIAESGGNVFATVRVQLGRGREGIFGVEVTFRNTLFMISQASNLGMADYLIDDLGWIPSRFEDDFLTNSTDDRVTEGVASHRCLWSSDGGRITREVLGSWPRNHGIDDDSVSKLFTMYYLPGSDTSDIVLLASGLEIVSL
jgi:hypothetical protein